METERLDLSVDAVEQSIIGKDALVTEFTWGEAWHENYIGEIGTIVEVDDVDDNGEKLFTLYFENRKKGDIVLYDEEFFEKDLIVLDK